jgi:hypothetical protein
MFARRIVAVVAMLLGAFVGDLLVLHVTVASALATAFAVGAAMHFLSQADAPWMKT